MRKIFEYIGLITLMCFSFFITEKTTLVVQNIDQIMVDIKNYSKNYEIEYINAKIINNEIIPGICGKKVNEKKSYNKMKKIGMFDSSLYVYDYLRPEISMLHNKNKVIIAGNPNKSYIYFFIELSESNKNYLTLYDFKNFNFIVNYEFFIKNINIIKDLIDNNNSILLNISDYKEYKKINKKYIEETKNNIYCFNQTNNNKFLNICSSNNSYSIKVNNTISNSDLLSVKKMVKRGIFIELNLNKYFNKNINNINKYINSKGLKLSNIDKTLEEC